MINNLIGVSGLKALISYNNEVKAILKNKFESKELGISSIILSYAGNEEKVKKYLQEDSKESKSSPPLLSCYRLWEQKKEMKNKKNSSETTYISSLSLSNF